MNKKGIKDIIKKTPAYSIFKRYKAYKRFAQKNSIGFFNAAKRMKYVRCDLDSILNKSKVKNIGVGNFFYSLDTDIMVNNKSNIIGNIPVDYAYIINCDIGNSRIEQTIKKYVSRINDSRVTLKKPNDLKSALQSILFWNSMLWQSCHSLVGLGRLDKVLAAYKTTDDAEELICDFLQTLHCEYNFKSATLKGDTGQIIILGGLEKDGSYFCNEYTYLFIKCLAKLHLPDPKILLRCSKNMPSDLLNLAVFCNSTGIGCPIFSNDDIIVHLLQDFGYEEKDAYNYGVSACWEPLSIGNSLEQNNLSNIEYGQCLNKTIMDERFIKCVDFDSVVSLFTEKLKDECNRIINDLDQIMWQKDPLLSFMMGLNKDISIGGAKYNNYGVLSVGMSSAVNSLLNIKNFVFSENKYTLVQIQDILKNNYENGEDTFSENLNGFGTDNFDAITITNYIIKETENNFKQYRNRFGGKVKFGLSSPGYIDIGKTCGATLDGRKAGEPFPTHISRDKGEPITEIINFESKLCFSGISANANVLDIMIPASLMRDNISKFTIYLIGGIRKGFFQLQMNVLSYDQLVDAKLNPNKYPNLIVRVWGFSAYFNDLPEEYKDHLIRRAKEMEKIA